MILNVKLFKLNNKNTTNYLFSNSGKVNILLLLLLIFIKQIFICKNTCDVKVYITLMYEHGENI